MTDATGIQHPRSRPKAAKKRGRPKQRSPLETFEANITDAELLLKLSEAFTNLRSKRLRTEMREKLGKVLRVGKRRWDMLDGIQSRSVFVVLLDHARIRRQHLADQGPLLRAVVVAACAAFETFVADIAKRELTSLLKSKRLEDLPKRLREVQMSFGDWVEIEAGYTRRVWGIRSHLEKWLEMEASTSPIKVGHILSAVGFENWAREVDRHRGVEAGLTVGQLKQIAERRNRIAHSLDRKNTLTPSQVTLMVSDIRSIAGALEELSKKKKT
jgi:hypothetical protein